MFVDIKETCQGFPKRGLDKQNQIIRGVKVLGEQSLNGRRYLPEALRRAAPHFEKAPVYVDHQMESHKPRRMVDRIGRLVNCRYENGSIFADLEYIKSHPLSGRLEECAEKTPWCGGLSINASGRIVQRHGENVVEEISKGSIQSVDWVASPASTGGLYESKVQSKTKRRKKVKTTINNLIERLEPRRPVAAKALREMAEAGLLTPDTQTEVDDDFEEPAASDAGQESDTNQAIREALRGAWTAIFDDMTLDNTSKIAKVKKLLAALESLTGSGPTQEGLHRILRANLTENRNLNDELRAARTRQLRAMR